MHRNHVKAGKKGSERRQYKAAVKPTQQFNQRKAQQHKQDAQFAKLPSFVFTQPLTFAPGRLTVLFTLLILSQYFPRVHAAQLNSQRIAGLVADRMHHASAEQDALAVRPVCPGAVDTFVRTANEFPAALPRMMEVLNDPQVIIACDDDLTNEVQHVAPNKILMAANGADSTMLLSAIRRAQNYIHHSTAACKSIGFFAKAAPMFPVNPHTIAEYHCALSAGDHRVLEFKSLHAKGNALTESEKRIFHDYLAAAAGCNEEVMNLVDNVNNLLRTKHATATPAAMLAYRESYTIANLTPEAIHVFYPEVEALMAADEKSCTATRSLAN